MEISRTILVEQLLSRGRLAEAERAERDLPERFSPMAHAEVLAALGVDPGLLATQGANLEDNVREG